MASSIKQYFDTSVLVAAFVADEPRHEACASLVSRPGNAYVLAHGLAECFSILTGGRLSTRISASMASRIIEENIVKRMTVVALTAKETLAVLKGAEDAGVRGGGIYDSLHLAAARKIDAQEIYTLNLRHFRVFAPDLAARLVGV